MENVLIISLANLTRGQLENTDKKHKHTAPLIQTSLIKMFKQTSLYNMRDL